MDIITLFKQIPLLYHLDKKILLELSKKTYEKTCPKNDILMEKGKKSGFLAILTSGKLKVTLTGLKDREIVLDILNPYNFIGDISLLDDEPHSATVIALEKSKLLVLSEEAFNEFVREDPSVCLYLLKHHIQLVRKLNNTVATLSLMDIYQRTAKKLIDLSTEQKNKTIKITHHELGNLIGANRENVTKSLNEIEKKGLIYMKKGIIKIKDSEGLEEIYIDDYI